MFADGHASCHAGLHLTMRYCAKPSSLRLMSDMMIMAVRRGHADSLASVGVSPDGSRFVSGGWDGAIHVWRTGARLGVMHITLHAVRPLVCTIPLAAG